MIASPQCVSRFRPIDRILTVEPGKRAEALRFISEGEPIFDEHFPSFPVLPGSFVLASAFATAGLLMEGRCWSVSKVERANFRRPAEPGEILHMNIDVLESEGLSLSVRFICKGVYDRRPLANGVFTIVDKGSSHE